MGMIRFPIFSIKKVLQSVAMSQARFSEFVMQTKNFLLALLHHMLQIFVYTANYGEGTHQKGFFHFFCVSLVKKNMKIQ